MKQFLKIHFDSELLRTVREEVISETYTAEIIHKNKIVASIESSGMSDKTEPINAQQTELIPAENTTLSDDGNTIKSLVAGYPVVERRQNGPVLSIQVKMVPLVHIQADKMRASITLYPALSGKQQLQQEELETILREEGILYGIDKAMLNESVSKPATLKCPLTNIPVARGILPIDGKDAYLRFELEIGPIPGTILRDGTIDFRERKIFTGVDENQVIAVRVPETTGTPGMNVLGEPIPQQPGKDITVKVSGDVSYIPETGQVIATAAGILSVVKGTEVKVSTKQTISGNIDFAVGNIESKNSVDITGSVHPGFSVKTKGDLRIGGNVESATIFCKGNVVVKGGLLGANSRLETVGDADLNFMERSETIAGGGIILRRGSYYSRVSGDGDIFCSPESKMIGSVFCCAGNFAGGDVGSPHAIAATIIAGVDGKRYAKYMNMKQEVLDIEKKLEILRTRKGERSIADERYRECESELQQLQADFRKLNLIPDSPEYSRNEPEFNYSDARITIQGTAATATKLRIGNLTKTLEDEYTAVEFFIDGDLEQIIAKPLTPQKGHSL
jgi:hypothetical protein